MAVLWFLVFVVFSITITRALDVVVGKPSRPRRAAARGSASSQDGDRGVASKTQLDRHYNGPSKPLANTTPPSFDEYNPPYLRHASRSEREDWAALSYDRMVQQRVRTEQQRRRWNTRRQRRRRRRRRDGNGEDYYYQDNNDESTTIYSSSSSLELNYRRAVIIVAASAATAQPYVHELHNVLNRTVCSWFTLPNADAKSSYGIVRWPADALSPEGSIVAHEDLLSMLNYEKSHTATMPSSSSSSGVRSAESGRPDWDLAMKSKQLLCTWSILSARLRDLAQLRGTQRSEICDEAEERYYRTSIVDAPLVGVEHAACGILRHDLEEWDTKTNNIDSLMQQAFMSFVQHAVFGVASKTQLDRIPCSCSSSRNLADRDSIVILQLIHPTSLPDLHEALLLMRQDSHSDPAVVIASLPGDEEAIAAMMDEVNKAKDRKSDVMIDFFVGNDNHSKTEWASNVYSLIAI